MTLADRFILGAMIFLVLLLIAALRVHIKRLEKRIDRLETEVASIDQFVFHTTAGDEGKR